MQPTRAGLRFARTTGRSPTANLACNGVRISTASFETTANLVRFPP